MTMATSDTAMTVRRHWRAIILALWSFPAILPGVMAAEVEQAERPRQEVDVDAESSGRMVRLAADGDFQAALDQAFPGDTIELAAGAVYLGPFTLPRKTGNQWISIRSSGTAGDLPAAGTRVTPADRVAMATLSSADGVVLVTDPGAHHYRFTGIEFRPASLPETQNLAPPRVTPVFLNTLVWLGSPGADGDDLPHHFIIERCYLHGDPEAGGRRGIVLNSAHTAVVDSWLSDFKMVGADSQAIVGWDGTGPFLINNNFLEAAGENVMFGGGDPTVVDRVPADIHIRGNHFSKPLAWMPGAPGYRGTRWSVKNLFELKNARRVVVEGNLFEYNWAQAQNGFAILFTVRNQEGTAPWSVVEDITFTSNVVRHVANGINILGQDDIHRSRQTRRIQISNNLFDDVGDSLAGGTLLQLLEGIEHLTISHNTASHSDKIITTDGLAHQDVAIHGNIVMHNRYGIIGTGTGTGMPTLERFFGNLDMQGNVIIGGARRLYPSGNFFPRSMAAVGFADAANGDFRLAPDSPYRGKAGDPDGGVDFERLCTALSATERPDFCSPGNL